LLRVFAGKKFAPKYHLTRLPNGLINCSKLEREENVMRSVPDRSVRLLASILICGVAMAVAVAANAQQEAITATVVGEMIQEVGFRAMIQKQAIMYNLAGHARNDPDGTVGNGAFSRLGTDRNRSFRIGGRQCE
jgi:uncharacterized membrane protein YgcG